MAKEIQKKINERFPPEQDNIFNLEIHECYYFEQLIYLELMDMVINLEFIRKCQCGNYFISNNRKRVYCDKCSSSRKATDQAYRKSMVPIKKIKQKYYHKKYYQLKKTYSSLPDKRKKELNEWNKKAQDLMDKYIKENRHDEIQAFEQELKKLNKNNE